MSDVQEISVEEVDAQWKSQCMAWCRQGRDSRLAATDYIHFPDVTVSEEYKAAVVAYRQELRDFPAAYFDIYDNLTDEEKDGITPLSIPFPVAP